MFLSSQSTLNGVYIRADGTSSLSVPIPFANGLTTAGQFVSTHVATGATPATASYVYNPSSFVAGAAWLWFGVGGNHYGSIRENGIFLRNDYAIAFGTTPSWAISYDSVINPADLRVDRVAGSGNIFFAAPIRVTGDVTITGTNAAQFKINAGSTQIFNVDCSGLGVVTIGNSTTSWTYPNIPQNKLYGNLRLKTVPTNIGQLVPIFEVDATDAAVGNFPVKFLDVAVSGPAGLSPGNPRTYFDSIFGLNTISYVNISGSFTGTGDSFKILAPFETTANVGPRTLMLGVRSDVTGAAVHVVANGDTESYPLLCGINNGGGTPEANFAIDRDGSIYMGVVTGVTDIGDSVQTYRTRRPGSMPGMDIRLYRDGGTLRTTSPFHTDQDLQVDGTAYVAASFDACQNAIDLAEFGPTLTAPQITPSGTSHGLVTRKQSTSVGVIAGVCEAEWAGTTGVTVAIQALNVFAHTITGTTGALTATANGGSLRSRAITRQRGSGTIAKMCNYSLNITLDGSVGTVTDAPNINIEAPIVGASSTLTNWYGMLFETAAVSGTLTNAYGIFIPKLSSGTNIFEIWLGTNAGIFYREATQKIYSSASKTLDYDCDTSGHQFRILGTVEFTFNQTQMIIGEANNITFGTITGTKLGTAASQKIGVWNATPIVRPSAYTQTYAVASKTHANPTATAISTTAATNVAPWGYTTQAQADAIVAAINALVVDVKNCKDVLNSIIDDQQAIGWFA